MFKWKNKTILTWNNNSLFYKLFRNLKINQAKANMKKKKEAEINTQNPARGKSQGTISNLQDPNRRDARKKEKYLTSNQTK